MADKKKKPPIYLIDTQSEFYRPLNRRIAICAAAALWAGIELWHQQPFWGVIAGATVVYCVYVLLLTYQPPATPVPRAPDPDEDESMAPVQPEAAPSVEAPIRRDDDLPRA